MKRYPVRISIKKHNGELRKFIKLDDDWYRYSRYIYELNFRSLRPGEEVHHKDEDRLNDDPDNLEALTKSEHTRRHMKGKIFTKEHCLKISLGKTCKK